MEKAKRNSDSWTEGPPIAISTDIFETSSEADASMMDISEAGSTPAPVAGAASLRRDIEEADTTADQREVSEARKKIEAQRMQDERQDDICACLVFLVISVFSAVVIYYCRGLLI